MIKKIKHSWRILLADKTGGFLECSQCKNIVFLEPKMVNKYKLLVKTREA